LPRQPRQPRSTGFAPRNVIPAQAGIHATSPHACARLNIANQAAAMKHLPASLQSHLDTGATTLAWCWRVTRGDGGVLGFTDHDRDLTFDGTTFQAATGFTPATSFPRRRESTPPARMRAHASTSHTGPQP
jgi:hypothetical protein